MKFFQSIALMALFLLPAGVFAQEIAGSWKMEVPTPEGTNIPLKAEMTADGTYALDFGMDGEVEVKGKYEVNGDQVTVWDTEGSDCTGKGVYQFTVAEGKLTMTRVTDECKNRGGESGSWTMTRM